MSQSFKTLQELTITDDFMFGAVMEDPENCRILLERILRTPIDHVEIVSQKNLKFRPEFKGVRLDVFAKDDQETRYDVEMQVKKTPTGKRSRYYHSQMDMDALLAGTPYDALPDSYVIFICDYDPFGDGKYQYTFMNRCLENSKLDINDGSHTIILNNKGHNNDEISPELLSFLQFTGKSLKESEEKSDDSYIQQIQNSIRSIKNSRDMGEQYMKYQLVLREQREEGKKEGLKEGRKEGIAGVITVMQESNKNKEEILNKIMDIFSLTEEQASEYYSKYSVN